MARCRAPAPRAFFLFGSVLVLQRCFPAESFAPPHLYFATSSRGAILPCHPAQRMRKQLEEGSTICASRPPARGWRGSSSSSSQLGMSSQSSRPSCAAPERTKSIGRTIVKGWVAGLLCVASLFAGSDVLRIGDEVASAAGLGLLRPPPASALSDEQVGERSARSPRY